MLGERGEGFLPGTHLIDAYGNGGFRFAGLSHKGSIIITAAGVHAWAVDSPEAIAAGTLGPLFDAPKGTIDMLLLGTGSVLVPVPAALGARLRAVGIRCDPMATAAAARTYNILVSERRRVAAALLAVP